MTFTLQLAVFLQLYLMVITNYLHFNFSAFTFFYYSLQQISFFFYYFIFFGPLPFLTVSVIRGEEIADGVITGKQNEANGNRHSLLGNYYRRKNANEP